MVAIHKSNMTNDKNIIYELNRTKNNKMNIVLRLTSTWSKYLRESLLVFGLFGGSRFGFFGRSWCRLCSSFDRSLWRRRSFRRRGCSNAAYAWRNDDRMTRTNESCSRWLSDRGWPGNWARTGRRDWALAHNNIGRCRWLEHFRWVAYSIGSFRLLRGFRLLRWWGIEDWRWVSLSLFGSFRLLGSFNLVRRWGIEDWRWVSSFFRAIRLFQRGSMQWTWRNSSCRWVVRRWVVFASFRLVLVLLLLCWTRLWLLGRLTRALISRTRLRARCSLAWCPASLSRLPFICLKNTEEFDISQYLFLT